MGADNGSKVVEPPTPSGGVAPKFNTKPDEEINVAKSLVFMNGFCCLVLALGTGIAFTTFKLGATEVYAAKMSKIAADDSYWSFAALVVIAYGIRLVNMLPMMYKEKVMKGALRDEIGANMRSNPFIYKVVGDNSATVLFANDGVTGNYNRANRSLTHMIENFGSVLAGITMTGSVFPFPTFVCACAFSVGRVMHQVGYSSGYGKHGLGFMVSTLATAALEGMAVLVVLAGVGVLAV